MTHICATCGSTEITQVEAVYAWFQEGDWKRQRTIYVKYITEGQYEASTKHEPEITGHGDSELSAIQALGEIIHSTRPHVKLLGTHIEED